MKPQKYQNIFMFAKLLSIVSQDPKPSSYS